MSDRELLELAAKAAGYKVKWATLMGGWADGYEALRFLDGTRFEPLADDGDALRLAVKLRLTVMIADHEVEVFDEDGECLVSTALTGGDHYDAATRRAIVRAAAEIGKRTTAREGE